MYFPGRLDAFSFLEWEKLRACFMVTQEKNCNCGVKGGEEGLEQKLSRIQIRLTGEYGHNRLE